MSVLASRMAVIVFVATATVIAAIAADSNPNPPKATSDIWQQQERRRQAGEVEGAEDCIEDLAEPIMECLHPLQEFQRPSAGGLHLELVNSSEKLQTTCHNLEAAHRCLASVLNSSCGPIMDVPTHVKVFVETTFAVVGYMCGPEGSRLIFSEESCWQKVDMPSVFDGCYANNEYNPDQACSNVEDLRDCLFSDMESRCSKDAALFVDRVVFYGMEPVARYMFQCRMRLRRISRSLLDMIPPK